MDIEDRITDEELRFQAKLEAQARHIARTLDAELNAGGVRDAGFALLLFRFGDPPQPATWISNADRSDMIRTMEGWLANARAKQ